MVIVFPNNRMNRINMSGGIREVLSKATMLERQGCKIIHMEIGRPDFDSPTKAKEAAKSALDEQFVHYTDMAGTDELREEIARKYKLKNNMNIDMEKNIVVTAGAIEALTASLLATLNPGDEVITLCPYFPAYADVVALAGGNLVEVGMDKGFRFNAAQLEASITPRTRFLLINTPNNPAGYVLTRQDLMHISEIVEKHDIWVLSDETYEEFIYDGEHVSIASLPGMECRTVTVSSASKTWSMTGWRVGWIICPEVMRPFVNKCHQNLTTCATSFAQKGVAEAFRSAGTDVAMMIKEYERRRNAIVTQLQKINGFDVYIPGGSFYIFPGISGFKMDGFSFCSFLLEKAGVAAVPGEVFGLSGYVRLAYCCSYDNIIEATERIKNAVSSL